MAAAYEGALVDLQLKDREDPFTKLIAKKIIEYAQRGERDACRLHDLVVEAEGRDLLSVQSLPSKTKISTITSMRPSPPPP